MIDRWCNTLSLITPYDFCIPVTRKLSPESARDSDLQKLGRDDAMATEKLAEGIRQFCADAVKLEGLIAAL